ncbi:hypothetical protein AKAW_07251 [Aspergillus luchuensis IFO 4308]|nr:hypothetical protein ALUC_81216S [Aspergillus luchuensis]GAA89137.1 hypothetical protein AKAW_07251 [Aspergillus luchuensis IFO 4308]
MPPTIPHSDGDTSPCQDYLNRVGAPRFDPFATIASGADDQEFDHSGTTNIDHSSAHTTTSWSLPGISPDRTFTGPDTSNPLVLPFGTIHDYDECTLSCTPDWAASGCIDPSALAETTDNWPMDDVAHENPTPASQSVSLTPGNIDDHEEGTVSCTPDWAASACIGQSSSAETTDNRPMDDVAHENPTNGLQPVSPSQGGHHETSCKPAYKPRLPL